MPGRRDGHTERVKSFVHLKYKTNYRVENWPSYDRALVRRGDITIWLSPEAIAAWVPQKGGRRGGQRRCSDFAIETALSLRLLFHQPLRQVEGFLNSVFRLMGVGLCAPDHTTLSRRAQHLDVKLHQMRPGESVHLIVDSTGLTIVGEGEWAAAKHRSRGRSDWRKLHLAVDGSGVIVAQILTDGRVDDAATVPDLLDQVEGGMSVFTADTAYDARAVYVAARKHGAMVVIPPTKAARGRTRPRCPDREMTVARVKEIGWRRWKKESGCHQQARVENAFFRYKSIIGDRLFARHPEAQETEASLGCNILNRMIELGRPASVGIGPQNRGGCGFSGSFLSMHQHQSRASPRGTSSRPSMSSRSVPSGPICRRASHETRAREATATTQMYRARSMIVSR